MEIEPSGLLQDHLQLDDARAVLKDESVEPSDLSQFTDAASISDYALEPTQYMVALGVVRGTGTALPGRRARRTAGGHRHVPPRVLHCQRVAAQK